MRICSEIPTMQDIPRACHSPGIGSGCPQSTGSSAAIDPYRSAVATLAHPQNMSIQVWATK